MTMKINFVISYILNQFKKMVIMLKKMIVKSYIVIVMITTNHRKRKIQHRRFKSQSSKNQLRDQHRKPKNQQSNQNNPQLELKSQA